MGEQVKPSHFQLFAVSLMHSETLEAALGKVYSLYPGVSDGGEYFLTREGDGGGHRLSTAARRFSYHQIDAVMVLLRSFANWAGL